MITLDKVPGVETSLGDTALKHSHIWKKPLDEIRPGALQAFLAHEVSKGRECEAIRILETLNLKVRQAVDRGEFAMPEFFYYSIAIVTGYKMDHRLDSEKITRRWLRDKLGELDPVQRDALVFACEMDCTEQDLVALTWEQLKRLPGLTETARQTARSQPRHMHSPYVFWRLEDGKPSPLHGIGREVAALFGISWLEVKRSYRALFI